MLSWALYPFSQRIRHHFENFACKLGLVLLWGRPMTQPTSHNNAPTRTSSRSAPSFFRKKRALYDRRWNNVGKRSMSLNQTMRLYEVTIPGQQAGTWARFKIFVSDKVGNNVTLDEIQPHCIYQIVVESPSLIALPLFMTIIACLR
jgi:hypothetical protein